MKSLLVILSIVLCGCSGHNLRPTQRQDITNEDCLFWCKVVVVEAIFEDDKSRKEALEIESGDLHICVEEKHFDAASHTIAISSFDNVQTKLVQNKRKLQVTGFTGTKKLLVVRVSSDYGEVVQETVDTIEGTIFGTGSEANANSAISQYRTVSHGALKFVAASGNNINGGVVDITVSVQIAGSDIQQTIMSPALAAVQAAIGQDVSNVADHLLFCIPDDSSLQGSLSWTAFTFLNEGYSVFQKSRCTRLSTLMHELGHSIGFKHSGKGSDDYGDMTCYMGYTVDEIGKPVKSFNAYKYWQAGWINSARMLDASPVSGSPKVHRIVPTVDYDSLSLSGNDGVLLNIASVLYAKYNIAKGYDIDLDPSSSGKVAVIEMTADADHSTIVAELGPGESFEYSEAGSGQLLTIQLCGVGTNPFDYAQVLVAFKSDVNGQDFCSSSNSSPALAPTSGDLVYPQSMDSVTNANTVPQYYAAAQPATNSVVYPQSLNSASYTNTAPQYYTTTQQAANNVVYPQSLNSVTNANTAPQYYAASEPTVFGGTQSTQSSVQSYGTQPQTYNNLYHRITQNNNN